MTNKVQLSKYFWTTRELVKFSLLQRSIMILILLFRLKWKILIHSDICNIKNLYHEKQRSALILTNNIIISLNLDKNLFSRLRYLKCIALIKISLWYAVFVGLQSHTHTHIYIYIYVCVCVEASGLMVIVLWNVHGYLISNPAYSTNTPGKGKKLSVLPLQISFGIIRAGWVLLPWPKYFDEKWLCVASRLLQAS